jgi:hypothetical protein
MSDVGERADDYERRLAKAGGTKGVIGGLVLTADRNRKIMWALAISLVADVFLSFAVGYFVLGADEAAHIACEQSSDNSRVVNELLADLIRNASTLSDILTPAEIEARVQGYSDLLIDIPAC